MGSWMFDVVDAIVFSYVVLIGFALLIFAVFLTVIAFYWIAMGIGHVVMFLINFISSLGGRLYECFK